MTQTEIEELAPRNHNLPAEIGMLPSLPLEVSNEAIEQAVAGLPVVTLPPAYNTAAHAAFGLRVAAFMDACGKWADIKEIGSAEQSERLTDFITGSRQLWQKVEDQRKADKKPHDDRAAEVQEAFIGMLNKLKAAGDKLKPMQAAWLEKVQAKIDAEKAEQKRLADEKAESARQLAAQAAARNDVSGEVDAAAALKEAEKELNAANRDVKAKAGSASGGGRSMAMRSVKTADIHSRNSVYMHFRDHPDVIELLQRLATQSVRAGFEFDPKILTVKIEKVAA